jgi:hypothetical protein
MAEPKPLTYDKQKAAEAAFTGGPFKPQWTEAAQMLYRRLAAELSRGGKQLGLHSAKLPA